MRWFNTFFHVLNAMLLCFTLIIIYVTYIHFSILNNILVYVNIGICLYSLIQCYIMYMNNVIWISKKIVWTSHMYYEQTKFFVYSLLFVYEHTDIHIVHKWFINNCKYVWLCECLFVWLHHTVYFMLLGIDTDEQTCNDLCKNAWRSQGSFVYLRCK